MSGTTFRETMFHFYYFYCSIGAWIIDNPNMWFYLWLVLLSIFFPAIGWCFFVCLVCEAYRRYSDGGYSYSGSGP